MVLAAPGVDAADLSSLDLVVYGGSPISVELLRAGLATLGCRFMQLYGLTESTGLATILPPDEHEQGDRLRSVGRPADGVELRVVDPDTGVDRPAGDVGEIWLRSAQIMAGYWRRAEETAEVLLTDGWLRTGDAAYVDADGYVFIHDRVKDMIVTGGENVYPAEVERALLAHPGVADVAVVGVPDDRWGETVKAVVVTLPDAASPEELIAFAREHLAHYKCPTSVDLVTALPRNASGKVLKRELREAYWAGRSRRVH
jgi:long-chain acyl-CoA synthetase